MSTTEHDHSAHAGMAGMDHMNHKHGSLEGHVLPGSMFLIWSAWWMLCIFSTYINSSARKPYKSRSWHRFPWAPNQPLEPILKIALPFFGVLIELFIGHGEWRTLKAADGKFESTHLNNWQHAAMYGAFCLSGIVDLAGHYGNVPHGAEQAFLSIAFMIEGILMAFHLKGSSLDILVHYLLALVVFSCAIFAALEAVWPQSVVMSCGKAASVFFQGTWFIQVGRIMYLNNPAWDPNYGGSVMFVPVVFVFHIMVIMTCMLLVYSFMCWLHGKAGQSYRVLNTDDVESPSPSKSGMQSAHAAAAHNGVTKSHGID